jgi:hypothetical protein
LQIKTYLVKIAPINQSVGKTTVTSGETHMTTTYEKMRSKVGNRRGRKPLPEHVRKERLEKRKAENRQRMEAKRRAWFVLENKYTDEFNKVYEEELRKLQRGKYSVKTKNNK